ncbi:MAG: hypothetical protein IT209_00055 [Armatimonadetes bacterium]|nr:hypothetical protein [Armatimonadota bacterium]
MTKFLAPAIAVGVLLSATAVRAAINLPLPVDPEFHQQTPQEKEQRREAEQADAPQVYGANAPATTDQAAYNKPAPAATGTAQSFANAFAAHERGETAGRQQTPIQDTGKRTRGVILMIAGVTGIVTLGGGRAVTKMLARTQAEHDEQDARTAEADESVRSYGGDHNQYIID